MSDDALKEELREIRKMLSNLDHMIRGNGQPGLATRISLLENQNKQRTHIINLIVSILAAAAAILAALK